MTVRTPWHLLRSGQLGVLLRLRRSQPCYYRLCFLGAAVGSRLLAADSPHKRGK